MKLTLNWLKQHIETGANVNELCDKLTAIGLEIEDLIDPAAALKDFIVAEVVEAKQHSDADRLKVLKVNTGAKTLQIVCGAPNAKAGMKAVLALPGVVIPASGEPLKKGVIRGVESEGMLCAEDELCLGPDHTGIIELAASAKVGSPASEYLNIDPIIEINITPNRADCLGVRNIARDLVAAGMGSMKPLNFTSVKESFDSPLKVEVKTEKCPAFATRVIRGVKNGPSPKWLADKLTAIGLRPISAIIDITNYVMFELNRPLHAFDAAKVKGGLTISEAKGGEKYLALDEKEYEATAGSILINDDEGLESLAGIMGGEKTGIDNATTSVILESALFDAFSIADAARKMNINSDAKFRFERYIDPESVMPGLDYATALILEICGGEASKINLQGKITPNVHKIKFRPERVLKLIGVAPSEAEMKNILTRLDCQVDDAKNPWLVTTPSSRGDLEIEEDLIEEVTRIYGYDKLPETRARDTQIINVNIDEETARDVKLRYLLASRGLDEMVSWKFTNSKFNYEMGKVIELVNPITSELDIMRRSLLPNLMKRVGDNNARGLVNLSMFEIGEVFYDDIPTAQKINLAVVRTGEVNAKTWRAHAHEVDVFDVKADLQAILSALNLSIKGISFDTKNIAEYMHPYRSALLKMGPKVIGLIGELHPRMNKVFGIKEKVSMLELDLSAIALPKKTGTAKKTFMPSSYQSVERDFAFVLKSDVLAADLLKVVEKAGGNLVKEVHVFDEYVFTAPLTMLGKKSLALNVVINSSEKTLTDAEVNAVCEAIVAAVREKLAGEIRYLADK